MMNLIRKIVFHPLLFLATCLGSLGIDLPAEALFDSSFPNPDAVPLTGGLISSGLSPTFTTSTENGILTVSDSQSANDDDIEYFLGSKFTLNGRTFDNVTSVPVTEPTTSGGLLLIFGVTSLGWVVRRKLKTQQTKR
jgi:hypothetical protein